ncbi:hypothetical protein OG225_06670 [Nocardia sp. NBC_01377]
MPNYTVVITPDSVGDQGESGDAPQLTVRVEATAQDARVTEIAISTTAPTGLTSQSLDVIDMTAIATALSLRFPPSTARVAAVKSAVPVSDRAPASASERIVREEISVPTRTTAVTSAAAVPGATGEDAGRAYRRMPDVSELRAAYENLGTVTAVAKHYGVPRHTAQGWMGRLRKLDQPVDAGSATNN